MKNMLQVLHERIQATPNKNAYLVKTQNAWQPITWAEVDKQTETLAAGLMHLGLGYQDKISIQGNTQLNWILCDLAGLRTGATTVGIYQTLTGEQAAYIVEKSESKILCLSDAAQFQKIEPYLAELPHLQHIIVWKDAPTHPKVMTLAQVFEKGQQWLAEQPEVVKQAEAKIQLDDVAVIIFTSGTTGHPKGACLTHKNIYAELNAVDQVAEVMDENEVSIAFLPLAHVGERVVGTHNRIYRGIASAIVEDFNEVLPALLDIQPEFFGSVPRIFEKIFNAVTAKVKAASPMEQQMFQMAMELGKKVATELGGDASKLPAELQQQYKVAEAMVFSKIKAPFGSKIKYCLSSAAPISMEILEFFLSAGLLILEGYGQTECSAFCTINLPDDYKLGSVGKALPGIAIKIAADGEILIKGDTVFAGYYKEPEKTKETIDQDGWLHSGDLGRLDEDGFLYIIGRKKEIIITAGGKNITPSNIEFLLMSHPLIEQAFVHGDKRNYLTALIGIEPETLKQWAQNQGLAADNVEALLQHELLLQTLQNHVDQVNTKLAQYETIKYFRVLPRLFSVDEGELTPTLKVKRSVVEEKYQSLLNSMYQKDEKMTI